MLVLLRVFALLALFFASPATAAAGPLASVQVVRDGNNWTAEYRLARAAPAWLFLHSALAREDRKPWRPRGWTVETPGVRLERRGWYDLLVADRGTVPPVVRIRFTPSTVDLEADYDPALIFSTGAVALFTDQFDVAPLASAAAAAKLPLDLSTADIAAGGTRVTFRDRGRQVLHAGERKNAATMTKGRSYVLFGQADIVDTPDIAAVIDPGLPAWLAGELKSSTPRLLAHYRSLLGPRSGPKPMLMATWGGPTAGRTSLGGSVLPGLVLMALEGQRLKEPSAPALDHMRWFVAHETAHFWLGQTIEYDAAAHSWITEGGADLLAIRTIQRIDGAYDPSARLNDAVAKCTDFARKPINSANLRSEHDAYYSCGAVFGLIAEAAQNKRRAGSGIGGFWKGLIEANRTDRVVSQAEWLAAVTEASGDPSIARDLRNLAERGAADPRREIASLFRRAGVTFETGSTGELRLK
jgi:hypothetical protein